MRKHLLAAGFVFGICSLAPSAFADVDAAGEAQIEAIVAQYPDGGAPLAAAIAAALEANPALADDVVAVASSPTATPAQQTAIGTGIGNATNSFADQGTAAGTAAANELTAAAANGPPLLVTAMASTVAPTAGGNGGGGGSTNLAGLTNTLTTTPQTSCVSPSHPGPC